MKKKYLTEDEKKVLELYHATQYIEFKSHELSPDEALKLVERLGKGAGYYSHNTVKWFNCISGKIEVTAFIKEEA